jgi:hypothetical protein
MLNITRLTALFVLIFQASCCFSADVVMPETTQPILKNNGYPPGVYLISPSGAHGLPNAAPAGLYTGKCTDFQTQYCGNSPTCVVFPPEIVEDYTGKGGWCPVDVYQDGRKSTSAFSWHINYSCPENYSWDANAKTCRRDPELSKDSGTPPCETKKGNPVNTAGGNKFQEEVIYQGAGSFPLRFSMFYNSAPFKINSSNFTDNPIWRDSYSGTLEVIGGPDERGDISYVLMTRPDGTKITFKNI